ncbi:MAG: glycosyltransferase [Myxococcota bacterium]
MRILLVQQEWPHEFRRSTQWSYISSLGYVEALQACGVEVTWLTSPWLPLREPLLKGRHFDQVWLIDLVHLEPPAGFFAQLEALAAVRVGLIGESLRYSAEELGDHPDYATRESVVRRRSEHLTHVLCCDEDDARHLSSEGVAALWLPPGMLRSLVVPEDAVQPKGPIGFIGEIYPKRARFFDHQGLRKRLLRVVPNDRPRELEARYLELVGCIERSQAGDEDPRVAHRRYNAALIALRREIYLRYLAAFSGLGATINPPTLFKSYPGRVYEAIARGVPVLSWRIPERPGAERLFEPGREIVLFDACDPDALCELLDRTAADPVAGRVQALRARQRLLADHTLEARCLQALRFMETTL